MVINKLIVCPHCKSGLKLINQPQNSLLTIAVCHCSQYPVIDGIILFNLSEDKIQADPYKTIINLLSFSFAAKVFFGITYHFRHLYKLMGFNNFITLLTFLGFPKNWSNYLKRRNKIPSFFIGLLTLDLIKNTNQTTLDLGCGTGNMLPFYYQWIKPKNIVLADSSFLSLFIARHFFAKPETTFIHLDLNQGLPIKDKSADLIYIIDSFHYFKNKRSILSESNRIMKKSSRLTIVHALNVNTPKDDYALPQRPEFITKFLKALGQKNVYAAANGQLWRAMHKNYRVKLEKDSKLNNAYAYNILSSSTRLPQHLNLKKKYSEQLKKTQINYYQDPDLSKTT